MQKATEGWQAACPGRTVYLKPYVSASGWWVAAITREVVACARGFSWSLSHCSKTEGPPEREQSHCSSISQPPWGAAPCSGEAKPSRR